MGVLHSLHERVAIAMPQIGHDAVSGFRAETAHIDTEYTKLHTTAPPAAKQKTDTPLEKRAKDETQTAYERTWARKCERTTRIEFDRWGNICEFDEHGSLQRTHIPDAR